MGRNCDIGTLSIAVLGEPEEENYRMRDICKDREALRSKYEQFIQTERGKEWKHFLAESNRFREKWRFWRLFV